MNMFIQYNSLVARVWAVLVMSALLVSAFGAPFSVNSAEAYGDHQDKLKPYLEHYICHATGNTENPFEKVTLEDVLSDWENKAGYHISHEADIIPVVKVGRIAKLFLRLKFPTALDLLDNGRNLETVYKEYADMTGQAIHAANCKVPETPVVTIVATKIICEDEALLPNWGTGAPAITEDTVSEFFNNENYPERKNKCKVAPDWQFQWTNDKVLSKDVNQMATDLGGNWNTSAFTDGTGSVTINIPTSELPNNNGHISFREAFKPGYIPFTRLAGEKSSSDVSAEIYCGEDNMFYDNSEWIEGAEAGDTVHCVAWNVPETRTCEFTMVSDELDFVVGKNASAEALSDIHKNWIKNLPSSIAQWIWGDDPVLPPTTSAETQTFKKSFNWTGLTVTDATLTVASDNGHAITLGTFATSSTVADTFKAAVDYDVKSAIVPGLNTLEIAVTNDALGGSTPVNNPAGLIYELKIEGTSLDGSCGVVVPEKPVEEPKTGTVTMCKVDQFERPLSGWQLALLGEKVTQVSVLPDGTDFLIENAPAGDYVLKASGTYVYRPTNLPADAAFSTRLPADNGYATAPYQPWLASTYYAPNNYLGVQVNGTLPWGEVFNPAHIYYASWNPTNTLNTGTFKITDTYYPDNKGSILVEAFTGFTGVTEKDGCVVFEDVPYGTYTVEELLQQGWENKSGLGPIEVNAPTMTHYVMNDNGDVPEQCVDKLDGDWANNVVGSDQKKLNNGNPITDINRTDADKALGVNDWVSGGSTGFFSLGFGGSIVVKFDNYVPNVPGNDIEIYEATNGTYPAETATVEVSQNGTTWITVGTANNTNAGKISKFDFDSTGLAWIKYVRVTDTTDATLHAGDADGFDLDAVKATQSLCEQPDEPAPICEPEVNLIGNGGFEMTPVTNPAKWEIFATGSTMLDWVVSWITPAGAPEVASLELHNGYSGWLAREGAQYAELDSDFTGPGGPSGEEASVAISQTIPTVAGANYNLAWYFSPRPNTGIGDNKLEVLVNNVVVKTNQAAGGAVNDWNTDNYEFVGTGAPMTVTFRDAGTANSEGTFIDNVSLKCRPADDGNGGDDGSNGDGGSGDVAGATFKSNKTSGTKIKKPVGGSLEEVTLPDGAVLGEQVSAVPYGGANAGAGGSQAGTVSIVGLALLALLGLLAFRRNQETV